MEDDTEADVSIPQEHSKLGMSVTSQTVESLNLGKGPSPVRRPAVARVPVREIHVGELPLAVHTGSRASSGRASQVRSAAGKVTSTKEAANKTIRVPPPTINPCNTMSHLKQSNDGKPGDKSHSLPISKLSMASATKLASGKCRSPAAKLSRLNSKGERSSTSHSNYLTV